MRILRHAGRMGDVLYSLYYATRLMQGEPFDLALITGVSAWDPSGRPHMMDPEDAEFMRPLLEAQSYIHSVLITDDPRTLPAHTIQLDTFRSNMRRVVSREIRAWYYSKYHPIQPDEFERPVLSLPDPVERTDRIAICFTSRYRQRFNLAPLKKMADRLAFIGLPAEHAAFCREHFNVAFHPVLDALNLFQFAASCRGFVGNVSGTYAIMECAKIPRILCLEPTGGNVRPYGPNAFTAASTIQLDSNLKTLFGD